MTSPNEIAPLQIVDGMLTSQDPLGCREAAGWEESGGARDAQATAITPILTPRLWTRIRAALPGVGPTAARSLSR
ncbi:hypothetical protein ACFYWN_37390 [Streptomyces sp. NPDC002917]|uniref:hypothetical protein n=1 Tax=Streptomyces sp. NPDC002917 TaxID=3364671 RepID=UPI0036924D66